MTYDPTEFVDVPEGVIAAPGTPDLDAGELNKIGAGIKDAHDRLAVLEASGGGGGGGAATPDATTSVKGKARLLGGTADAPTVPWGSVTGKPTIPTTPTDIGAQPVDPDLTTISAIDAGTPGMLGSDGAGWLRKTYAQVRAALGLATVATTGAYTDLSGRPTIPTTPADIGAQPAGSYATTSALASGLAGKADDSAAAHLAGAETLTGVKTFSVSPVVPTPTASGQAASRGYVDTAVAALVNAAPGTLDTLGELATQLAADESAAAALTTVVGGKLGKSSNLGDLPDAAAARTNLGLGSAATRAVGTGTGTVAAGDDTRLSDARTPTAHGHAVADVTGLQTALDGKQPADADLTGLGGLGDGYPQRAAGTWSSLTAAQLAAALAPMLGGETFDGTHPPVTGLPHVTITTTSGADPTTTDTYLDATMTINGAAPYSGTTQIRGRGNSTWTLPKKPWRIKLTTTSELLGMPTERDWFLLANHLDPSKIRNAVAFEIAGRSPGLAWTPQTRMVELTMNGTYRGIYQLGQHIERGTGKIPGSAASGTSGLPLTGVYTLEIDRRHDAAHSFDTTLGVAVTLDDPDGSVAEQLTYIQTWVQNFETVLMGTSWLDPTTGYAQYIDMASWVDWYIVAELMANLDSDEYSSIKMYKTRDVAGVPGRLVLGPVWDYDNSAGVNNFGAAQSPTAPWVTVNKSTDHPGFRWVARMLTDPTFFGMVVSRWATLRASLSSGDNIYAVVDRLTDRLTYAVARDKRRWTLTTDVPAHVDDLKTWLRTRIAWLNTQWVIDITAPSVPTGLSATPGAGQVVLSWTASTDDVAVHHYVVRQDGVVLTPNSAGTTRTVTGLTNGTSYSFTVAAVDNAGNTSAQSSAASGTPAAGSGGFSPSSLSGLVAWWDASDASTLFTDTAGTAAATSAGAGVARMSDKSGSGYHFTQSTAGSRPALTVAAQNGRNAIYFDGTDDGMQAATLNPSVAFPNGFTIFVATKLDDTADRFWSWIYGSTPTGSPNALMLGKAGAVDAIHWGAPNWHNGQTTDSPGFAGAWHTLGQCEANSERRLLMDGSTLGTETNPNEFNSITDFYLGARQGTEPWKGPFGEMAIWSRVLTSSERGQVQTYLKAKWGTP